MSTQRYPAADTYALDAYTSANRTYDSDGRLHIARSRISVAQVSEYYGAEIPHGREIGLDSKQRYGVYRDRDELAQAASTFARVPVYGYSHTSDFDKLDRQRIIGTTGSNVTLDSDGYLVCDMTIWDKDAIKYIERGEIVELSCGYKYTLDPTPGTLDSKPYIGIMRGIQGNHVALVRSGRAGHEVRVGDAKGDIMSQATDAVATDGSMEETAMRNLIDIAKSPDAKTAGGSKMQGGAADMDDEDDETEAMDALEKRADKVAKKLAKRKAKEAAKMDKKEVKVGDISADEHAKALDSAMQALRAEQAATHRASIMTRAVLGDIALDSAEAYYTKALDELKIGHAGVTQLVALETLFGLALSQRNSARTAQPVGKVVDNKPGVDVAIDLAHLRVSSNSKDFI